MAKTLKIPTVAKFGHTGNTVEGHEDLSESLIRLFLSQTYGLVWPDIWYLGVAFSMSAAYDDSNAWKACGFG